jgi:putative phage-type endonuclease
VSLRILTCEQRTPEWFAARIGRVTGSRAADMLATIKTGEAAARRDYRLELVIERLTGQSSEDTFITRDMQRGMDLEPFARAAYEAELGRIVDKVGFASRDDIQAGCSPDGIVGSDGLVEIKCPKSATHVKYLKAGAVPSDYAGQVMHNLWVTGRAWCDFVSFDDRMPIGLQYMRVRVLRDDKALVAYESLLRAFLVEVDAEEADLRQRIPLREAA